MPGGGVPVSRPRAPANRLPPMASRRTAAPEHVYRSTPLLRRGSLIVAAALPVVLPVVIAATSPPGQWLGGLLVGLLLGVFGSCLLLFVTRPAVFAFEDDVAIRGYFGTQRFHWASVRSFGIAQGGTYGWVELDDGSRHVVTALQTGLATGGSVTSRSFRL